MINTGYDSKFFVCRTPILPVTYLIDFFDILRINDNPGSLKKYLISIFKQDFFRHAIKIASPDLYVEVDKYLSGETFSDKKTARIEKSLILYFLRMSSRCTPFGIFSGVSFGSYGELNNILLKDIKDTEVNFRADSQLTIALIEEIKRTYPEKMFSYYTNSSIFKYKDQLRYIEKRYANKNFQYELSAVQNSRILSKILNYTKKAVSYEDVVKMIEKEGYTRDDCYDFIHSLIESQVLINALDITTEGISIFGKNLIPPVEGTITNTLPISLYQLLEKLNATNKTFTYDPKKLDACINETHLLNQTLKPVDQVKNIHQVDCIKPTTEASLNAEIIDDLISVIHWLHPLNTPKTKPLDIFREIFYNKYGDNAVALLEVMDWEVGIQYNEIFELDSKQEYNELNRLKLTLYKKSLKTNSSEVTIEQNDLKLSSINNKPIPDAFKVYCKIFKDKNGKAVVQFINASGPPGITLVAKAGFFDADFKEKLINVVEKEEALYPEKIFAEISHVSEPHTGNIVYRPRLRDYEIQYLTYNSDDNLKTIPLNDLFIKHHNNKLILFSQKLKKEIIPRLSSAHNFHLKTLPLYKFLGDLQFQNYTSVLFWDWGMLQSEDSLPRITYKNIILSPKIWNIKAIEFKHLKADRIQLNKKFKNIKEEFKIPDMVFFSNGDNELLLDISIDYCVEILFQNIDLIQIITLKECLFFEYEPIVKNKEGGFISEFILPYTKLDPIQKYNPNLLSLNLFDSKRNFQSHGADWIYLKLYIPEKLSNYFIANKVYPLIKKLKSNNAISEWFFIRYFDPDFHVRLRVKPQNDTNPLIWDQFYGLFKKFVDTGSVTKLTMDAYKPEIDRYGVKSMNLSETLFTLSSEMTMNIIRLTGENKLKEDFVVNLLFDMLYKFNSNSEWITKVVKSMVDYYSIEFQWNSNNILRKNFQDEYRILKPQLFKFIDERHEIEDEKLKKIANFYNIFNRGARKAYKQYFEIDSKLRDDDQFITSHIHMLFNRLYLREQRLFEFKCYYFLLRYLKEKEKQNEKKLNDD